MKRVYFTAMLSLAIALGSCSSDDSSSNLPENERLVSSVNYVSADDSSQNRTLTINYDTDGKIMNVSDGEGSSTFVYDGSNSLTTITGSSDMFSISELYQAPYDGYEFGEVLDYDNNGNPVEVRLFERDWDGTIYEEYQGFIYYDTNANPFLHTMNAAGLLDILDDVDLNFSAVPQSQELMAAKQLIPNNNPKRFVVKNMAGETISEMVAQYVYDNTGYPTSATFTETNSDGVSISSAVYNYVD